MKLISLFGCRGKSPGIAIVASTLLVLWLMPAAQAQFHVQLSPQLVTKDVRPGARGSFEFSLLNQDDTATVQVLIRSGHIWQGLKGDYKISDSATAYSCADWIEVPETLVAIPPNSARKVSVNVKVPTNAVGGAYGAVIFEVLPPEAASGDPAAMAAHVRYRFQMPAWLELTIRRGVGTRKLLKARKVEVSNTADEPRLKQRFSDMGLIIDAEVENTGNVHVFTNGRLIIRDADNRLITDTRLGHGRGAVLPGATSRLRTITQMPGPGTYAVKAIIDYGGRSPATAQTTLEVGRKMASKVGDAAFSVPLEVEIKPEVIDLSAPINSFRPFGATVINREKFPVKVVVKPGQLYHDINGGLWTTGSADSGRTIVNWIEYDPKEFVVKPNRTQNIRINLKVPPEAAGGYYGGLLMTAKAVDTVASAQGFLPSELSLPIYVTVPPAFEYEAEIVAAETEETQSGGFVIKAVFENRSNVHCKLAGSIRVDRWDEDKAVSDSITILSDPRWVEAGRLKIQLDTVLIFPGERRMLSSETVEVLPPGRYRASIDVNYGPKQPVTMDKEFVVKPRKN